jgi:hypothetical protein
MMHYDFIEIGTSDYKTLIQQATDDTIGISVEPLKFYLDNLPNPKNVKKINCAISADNSEAYVDIYYIPNELIEKNELVHWMKGCNKVGYYHYQHTQYKDLVSIEKNIRQIPISKLFIENSVDSVDFLTVDTEGSDCYILRHLLDYLHTKPSSNYPKKIRFECNGLTDLKVIDDTIELYINNGYQLAERTLQDAILIYTK